ncbi:MAG: hypothetical protein IVW57_17910, partial [Ktedonobacterales bacterium]|nr:hypothetical protein [Ktedonobacterales bacterium]
LCTVPLFSTVATNAGLRALITGSHQAQVDGPSLGYNTSTPDASSIFVQLEADQPSVTLRTQAQQIITPILQQRLGAYLAGPPIFTFQTQPFPLAGAAGAGGSGQGNSYVRLMGSDIPEITSKVTIEQGRLPLARSGVVEVALTQSSATALRAAPGATLRILILGQRAPSTLPISVVGIFSSTSPDAPFYGGSGFLPQSRGDGALEIQALASNDTLLSLVGAVSPVGGQSQGGDPRLSGPPNLLSWSYPLDLSRLTTDHLDALLNQINPIQTQIPGALSALPGVQNSYANPQALYILQQYGSRVAVLQIPVTILLLQVLGLVLLFVRLMADLLVDRQSDAIAVMRSRGAARRQIFGALTLQGLALGLIALVVGPLLAIPLVRWIAANTLAPADRGAVSILGGNPLTIAYGVRWYALAAVLVSTAALIFSVNRAASFNVLALRRESARATTKPLWQRLHLDLIAAAIGLALYVMYIV